LAPLASRRLAINLAAVRHINRRWRAHENTSGLLLGYALRVTEIWGFIIGRFKNSVFVFFTRPDPER
jgi:hypothetical protein